MVRVGANCTYRAFFARNVNNVILFGGNHGPELQAVVERHQPSVKSENDGKGPGDEQAGKNVAQVFQLFFFPFRQLLDFFPERGGDYRGNIFIIQPLLSVEKIDDIGDYFGVSQQVAFIAVHFNKAPVGVVRRNLTVVYDRIIQKCKGVRSAPPARRVGRVTPVGAPAIALVIFQAVEVPDIFGKSDRFKYPHVLSAGKHIGAVDFIVDIDDAACYKFLFVESALLEFGIFRIDKIAPDQRNAGNIPVLPGLDTVDIIYIKVAFQKPLCGIFSVFIVVEQVECVLVFIFRVNPIAGKPAAQAVGTVINIG